MPLPGPAPKKLPGTRRAKPFRSTEHLSTEAIASFADRELSASAMHRARVHIVQCEECRGEVNSQRTASERLRCCNAEESVKAPPSLVQKLSNLTNEPIEPGPDARIARSRDPETVSDMVEVALRAFKRRG